jgi:hypothetical protein
MGWMKPTADQKKDDPGSYIFFNILKLKTWITKFFGNFDMCIWVSFRIQILLSPVLAVLFDTFTQNNPVSNICFIRSWLWVTFFSFQMIPTKRCFTCSGRPTINLKRWDASRWQPSFWSDRAFLCVCPVY